ncbi:MAG: sigma 54-interacting transcriptional regulator [Acidobacteria bacterium]|nr:sigma 54-interacting transcriptional regulator [Acidobacteriota bacterium]
MNLLPVPSPEGASLGDVLAEIAQLASQTLELQEVFDQVADSMRRLMPFDDMKVVRVVEPDHVVVHATTFKIADCTDGSRVSCCWEPIPLAAWSPRLRPRGESLPPLLDAEIELDPQFPADRRILEAGVRSGLWEPFHTGERFAGGVIVSSAAPRAFTEAHCEMLRPIAALLGSAVEHWRIWDADRRRHQRFDRMEALLGTLAGSLDVREVFDKFSTEVQSVLRHDLASLTEIDSRRETLKVVAHAGMSDIEVPRGEIPLTREEHELRADFEILDDIPAVITPRSERERLLLATGMRSWLRVPVRLSGEIKGSLSFFAREAEAYDRDDAEVALRIADRLALSLSYRRLAEEAQIASEARERAARLEATVETLTRELETRGRGRVVGDSPGWRDVLRQVGQVADSETTVLITGESGTGKEIVSRLIHDGSARAKNAFVAVNCAALPEQLLESELFGHEKGAFTGAVSTKIGRLEQAAGGTLFLDEIGEMSPIVQAKLLRVLQEREFQRLGGTRAMKANVRVLAATNRDLIKAIGRGEFRDDLYYRLNVFEIGIPPLRDRAEDIPALAAAFVDELGRTMGRPAAGISRDAHEWLLSYPWPGNVRELRNAIERAILLCDGGLITRDHLPTPVRRPGATANGSFDPDPGAPLPAGGVSLGEVERGLVERALRDADGNKSRAARLLGISRAQLYSRIERFGISS